MLSSNVEFSFLGLADDRVQGKTGLKNYNIKLILSLSSGEGNSGDSDTSGEKKPEVTDLGILYDEARKCVMKGWERFSVIFSQNILLKVLWV